MVEEVITMHTTNNSPCAEVIESSLSGWTGQCWQWDMCPSFGSLVTISTRVRTLFGLVYEITTGSMDPGRYPCVYQKTQEELRAEQPQIFEFLKTTFSSMIVGYQQGESLIYMRSPEPPAIHAFIGQVTVVEASQFFASDRFLHLIFGFTGRPVNNDELLLAVLKYQSDAGILTYERARMYVRTYALLVGNDYRRLKFFSQRVTDTLATVQ